MSRKLLNNIRGKMYSILKYKLFENLILLSDLDV